MKTDYFGTRRSVVWLVTVVTCAYAGLFFWMTHAPTISAPTIGRDGIATDKIVHFCGYTVLAFLTFLLLKAWRVPIRCLLLVVALGAIAAIDELTQSLTFRDPEWLDWCADLAGVVAGVTAGSKLTLSRRDPQLRGVQPGCTDFKYVPNTTNESRRQ
jgi:hypothetical protein